MGNFFKQNKIFFAIIIGTSVVTLGFGIAKGVTYNHVEGLIKLSEEAIKNENHGSVSELLKEARVKAITKGQQKKIDYLFIEELFSQLKGMIERGDYLEAIILARNTIPKVVYPESQQRIENKIKECEDLQKIKDENNYLKGLEEFNKSKLIIASDFLEKISSLSPLHEQAQSKLIEAQNILKENCYIKATFAFSGKVYIHPDCNYEIWDLRAVEPLRGDRYFCEDYEAEQRGWKRDDICPDKLFSSRKYREELDKLLNLFKSDNTCSSFDYKQCREKCEKEDPIFLIKCEVCEGMKDACSSYYEGLEGLIP
jgi:hypothetical protein